MGQAKQRGSLEERIELASAGRDERVGALRETLGIPDAVKFGGYLVKVDDGDEFVSALGDQRAYASSPDEAKVFGAFDEAIAVADSARGEVVVALFDFGAKVIVVNVPEEVEGVAPMP